MKDTDGEQNNRPSLKGHRATNTKRHKHKATPHSPPHRNKTNQYCNNVIRMTIKAGKKVQNEEKTRRKYIELSTTQRNEIATRSYDSKRATMYTATRETSSTEPGVFRTAVGLVCKLKVTQRYTLAKNREGDEEPPPNHQQGRGQKLLAVRVRKEESRRNQAQGRGAMAKCYSAYTLARHVLAVNPSSNTKFNNGFRCTVRFFWAALY